MSRRGVDGAPAGDFDGESTRLEVQTPEQQGVIPLASDEVRVGQQILLRLLACNAGTLPACEASARLEFPEGLAYAPGSLRVDGRPFPEPGSDMLVRLGDIAPRETSELLVSAAVTSPAPNGRVLPFAVNFAWANGSRTFSRLLSVVSEPRFSKTRTRLRRVSPAILEIGRHRL